MKNYIFINKNFSSISLSIQASNRELANDMLSWIADTNEWEFEVEE